MARRRDRPETPEETLARLAVQTAGPLPSTQSQPQTDPPWVVPAAWMHSPPPADTDPTARYQRFVSQWPADLLVLLWPRLFAGRGSAPAKRVAAAVVALLDAGLVHMESGSVWPPSSARLLPGTAAPYASTPWIEPPPWVGENLLQEVFWGRGRQVRDLHKLNGATAKAAQARRITVRQRRNFVYRPMATDPRFEEQATAAASEFVQVWDAFRAKQPRLYRQLVNGATTPDSGGG